MVDPAFFFFNFFFLFHTKTDPHAIVVSASLSNVYKICVMVLCTVLFCNQPVPDWDMGWLGGCSRLKFKSWDIKALEGSKLTTSYGMVKLQLYFKKYIYIYILEFYFYLSCHISSRWVENLLRRHVMIAWGSGLFVAGTYKATGNLKPQRLFFHIGLIKKQQQRWCAHNTFSLQKRNK